ncbi:MAG: sugar ABC transporter permease YjfF [Spirochaetaceae bacterium]|jgi:ribose/xylose/arabinose/galactoside ABC-type transport system permease subunit|nr:sugar ABC transporter permease YjfF [Spirochaetaceae bacterium]
MNIRQRLNNISILTITISLFLVMFIMGIFKYGFGASTFLNLLNDNGYLIIATVGIFFVLIIGGIDISIGSTVAFTCVFSAWLLQKEISPLIVIPIVLSIGFLFGSLQGFLIVRYKLQPFIVTLAGMFLMRALCAIISNSAIAIKDPTYIKVALAKFRFSLWGQNAKIYYYVILALFVVLLAAFILRHTKLGRTFYAIGGNEQSATLMGLPVKRIKVLAYAISSFCAALGGVVYSLYTLAGYSLQNVGLELDAISSAVIGGTLLTGGVGSVFGATIGVLIQGLIQTVVTYQNLNTWWTKVTVAALLCGFIIFQRFMTINTARVKQNNLIKESLS